MKTTREKLWMDGEWSERMRKTMSDNTTGDKNPNWRGGVYNKKCICGEKMSYGSITCMSCRNILGEKNPFFNKKHTEETKKKISNKLINKFKESPNFKYVIPEDKIYNLYIVQNKTINQLSNYFNCSNNTINNNLRGYGIYKDKSNKYNLNKIDILNYLKHGLNYVQIGKKYECSNKIIHKFIKKNNIYVK
jgi:hypothetical protein